MFPTHARYNVQSSFMLTITCCRLDSKGVAPVDPAGQVRSLRNPQPQAGASLPDGTHISTAAVSLSSPAGLLACKAGMACSDLAAMQNVGQAWTGPTSMPTAAETQRESDSIHGVLRRNGPFAYSVRNCTFVCAHTGVSVLRTHGNVLVVQFAVVAQGAWHSVGEFPSHGRMCAQTAVL